MNNNDLLNRRDRSLGQPRFKHNEHALTSVNTYEKPRTGIATEYHNVGAFGLFRIVLILLLLVNVMRFIIAPDKVFTFTGLLDAFQYAPTVSVGWIKSFTYWGSSLTSIPLIGDALAFLTNLVSVALFGATGIIQVALYIGYFARILFV